MSDDPNAPADLSSIGIDLSQIFRPSWTVEPADSSAQLAAKYDEGDRPERSHRSSNNQGGNRRSEGRGQHRGPLGDRDPGNRNSRGSRSQSGSRRGERDQSSLRDPRDRRQEDRPPEPKLILEGWKITLTPEHSALEAIAKQIRSRAKAYPLFELARLIIHLSDRYRITLQAESENSPRLFRAKPDGSLWTSRKEAISHLLSKHLEKFYRRSTITVEAPKGSYSVVAQCGMSGVLLGPPNHHEYQSRLLALHAARFKNLPFEVYKTRIKMMRDDTLMEQWKTEQSTRTIFIPIEPGSELAPAIEEAADAMEQPGTASESRPEETSLAIEAAEAISLADTKEAAETQEAGEDQSSAPEELPINIPPSDGPQLDFEAVTEHFYRHHSDHEVEPIGSEITLPGRIALHESDPLLHNLLIRTLQELDRFPLPLAQIIGKELASSGLQIFKADKKIIHVSVARPRYLDRATTPTSEGFRGILDYLEAHPKQPRDKQWAGLLALRTEPAGTDAESIHRREQALGTDLLWLLHQGHVLDFAMGNLQAALPPVQQPKPEQISAKKQVPSTETSKVPTSEMVKTPEAIVEECVKEEGSTEIVIEAPLVAPISTSPPAPIPVSLEVPIKAPVAAPIRPIQPTFPQPHTQPDSHGLGHA